MEFNIGEQTMEKKTWWKLLLKGFFFFFFLKEGTAHRGPYRDGTGNLGATSAML